MVYLFCVCGRNTSPLIMKQAITGRRRKSSCSLEVLMKREVSIKVTFVLIPLAIACMAFGIYRGEVATVLAKAINICMECIGLG